MTECDTQGRGNIFAHLVRMQWAAEKKGLLKLVVNATKNIRK